MLLFKAEPGFLSHILLAKGHYVIPRRDGRILVGSTMEDVGFDKSTTHQAMLNLRHFIHEYIPGLLNFPLERQWAGLRPGSPNGIPVIAPHPEIKDLYINAGHFRNGVVLAPASAKLLTDIIEDQPSFVDPTCYGVEAFLGRKSEICSSSTPRLPTS